MEDVFRRVVTALQTGNARDAEQLLKNLLSAQPRHVGGLNLYSVLLTQLGRFEEAERYVKLALRENATSDATFYNYGIVLKALRRPAEAWEQFTRALAINPSVADTWNNRGTVLNDLARYEEAIADFDKAISLSPGYAAAFYNKGKSLAQLRLHDQALSAYDRSLALKPDLAEAWLGRGNIFIEKRDYGDAYAACDRAFSLNPSLKFVAGTRLQAKLHLCDWTNLDADIRSFAAATREGKLPSTPFVLLSTLSSPADQLVGAKRYADEQPVFPAIWRGEKYTHDRIRIAYLSPDLSDHPVAQQTVGVFEEHDRSRFDITAISFGPESGSDLSRRVRASFERFLDVRSQSDQEIAELIRSLEIDIAVDLCGYTQGSRPNILARRTAPIQVNYLGYAGTMGTAHVDYILADHTVIPRNHLEFFSEQVAWLPDSFMASDVRRSISPHTPTRSECGLPEFGFVFCCFNNAYKILPDIFQVWMRVLKATGNSVLWLASSNPAAAENLRREAQKFSVSPERLIFAPRVAANADHLARFRRADLFLDTLPFNGHATTSDALWAGVPVLTCLGSTFAGRVAASQLNAAGLSELIAPSLEGYEAMALKLANDPSLIAGFKNRLARDRDRLFNTARFTRHIEAAYAAMQDRHRRQEWPRGFAVDSIN